MIIILPDEIDGLIKVEKNLENISINYLKEIASSVPLRLFVPKFKIESTIELNDVLSRVSFLIYLSYLNTYSDPRLEFKSWINLF